MLGRQQHSIWEPEASHHSNNSNTRNPSHKVAAAHGVNHNLAQGGAYLGKKHAAPNLALINENGFSHGKKAGLGSATGQVEGFQRMIGPTAVDTENAADNSAAINQENKLSREVSEYALAQRMLMEKTQAYIREEASSLKREKNIYITQANTPKKIKTTWQGCVPNDGALEQQTDLGTNTTMDSCKTRASDLGYSVFGMAGGNNNTCYVGNQLAAAQKNGWATKILTSFTFPQVAGATVGGVYYNGQIGSYINVGDTRGLLSTPVKNCDAYIGGIINTNTSVATWGYNCNVAPTPKPPPVLLVNIVICVGAGSKLYIQKSLSGAWFIVNTSMLFLTIFQLKDGSFIGTGLDNNVYIAPTLSAATWTKVNNTYDVYGIIQLQDGSFVCIGTGYNLYTTPSITGTPQWSMVQNTHDVYGIIQLLDQSILIIGANSVLYKSPSLFPTSWSIVGNNNGTMQSITQLSDSSILGVGMDDSLYTLANLSAEWTIMPVINCCVMYVTTIKVAQSVIDATTPSTIMAALAHLL